MKPFLILSIILSIATAEQYDHFLMPLTNGDNSRYTDTSLIQNNAQFFVAADLYDDDIGNIEGSFKKDDKLFIIVRRDTLSPKEFQEYCLSKRSLREPYKTRALELIKGYHNWILTTLCIKNKGQGGFYTERTRKMARELGVEEEYLEMEPELIAFMEGVFRDCLDNPKECN
jgi:hypothetical protein